MGNSGLIKRMALAIACLLFSQCSNINKGIVVSKNYEPSSYKKSFMFTGKTMIPIKRYVDPYWVIVIQEKNKKGEQKLLKYEVDSLTFLKIQERDSIIINKNRIERFWSHK